MKPDVLLVHSRIDYQVGHHFLACHGLPGDRSTSILPTYSVMTSAWTWTSERAEVCCEEAANLGLVKR